jgi:hypothetical protein
VAIAGAQAGQGLVHYSHTSSAEGMSGGALLVNGRVVGAHIQAGVSVSLWQTDWPQRCIDAVDRAMRSG